MEKTNPAYFIFDVKIHNLDGMKVYGEKVESTYKRYGGKRVIRAADVITIEGHPPQGHLVVLQFDSIDKARAWHDSPEYQEIVRYRHEYTDSNVWLVEGLPSALA
ncbi:DUF1330 domain-containing protein [Vibrio natriegens]|uniref:DUF1330 domain-containing protein n=1 Tax=Vibrio natriegens TaxID=691 RepID=UPI003B599C07